MRYLLSLFAALLTCFCFSETADAERTTRRGLKVDATKIRPASVTAHDTIKVDSILNSVTLTGFDKPLRSGRETVFVKNKTVFEIESIVIECVYLTTDGRQLHKREVTVPCSIPAGENRQIGFRSWDTQGSFYYELSAKPKRASGSPFAVKCRVIAIITPSLTDND